MQTAESSLLGRLAGRMRTPRLRTLAEFAEAEIILPDGPYQGQRFRLNRAPAARLLLEELGSGRWRKAFVTGPNQDGKSLVGFVIPLCYDLFERRETTILGVPTLDMWRDKWRVDIEPVIRASRYRDLLPDKGAGSKQGDSILLSLKNGVHLRCMTGGGDDQSRAGFTARNLIVTETDGFDEVSETSREGSKFDQLVRRTLAFGDDARIIAECTVSTEQGRTWQEIQRGSNSRICIPCPHCGQYVTPEREHFVGWQEAASEREAGEAAHVACPGCGAQWTNEHRVAANHKAVLAHRGQQVDAGGRIVGPSPDTDTLGFRWTVVNTILKPERLRLVAVREWEAKRAADEDSADRDVSQSQWALPAKPDAVDLSQLDYVKIMARARAGAAKGVCPEGTEFIVVGCDIGKRLAHWVALAFRAGATPHAVDYGVIEIPSDHMAEENAILAALRDWRDDTISHGWRLAGEAKRPVLAIIDGGYKPGPVFRFTGEPASGELFIVSKGFGATQRRVGEYKRDTGSRVVAAGESYNLVQMPDGRRYLEVNTDAWKSHLHARLKTPVDQPGAMTLYDPGIETGKHLTLAKHLTSEKQVEEFEPGQGTVTKWVAVSRQNHYFDAATLACVAGHIAGARVGGASIAPPPAQPTSQEPASNPLNYRGRW